MLNFDCAVPEGEQSPYTAAMKSALLAKARKTWERKFVRLATEVRCLQEDPKEWQTKKDDGNKSSRLRTVSVKQL
jgi:hypothetical protein